MTDKYENTLFGNVRQEILDAVRSDIYLSNTERIDNNVSFLLKDHYEQERNQK